METTTDDLREALRRHTAVAPRRLDAACEVALRDVVAGLQPRGRGRDVVAGAGHDVDDWEPGASRR